MPSKNGRHSRAAVCISEASACSASSTGSDVRCARSRYDEYEDYDDDDDEDDEDDYDDDDDYSYSTSESSVTEYEEEEEEVRVARTIAAFRKCDEFLQRHSISPERFCRYKERVALQTWLLKRLTIKASKSAAGE